MVRKAPVKRAPKHPKVERVLVRNLHHIEGFSEKRVRWLRDKILREGIWKQPLALDDRHGLVLDGQHRMEVAVELGLKWVPAVRFRYATLHIWSLRPAYEFDWKEVERRALRGAVYPYKTVKHEFPFSLPPCEYSIGALKR